MIQLPTQKTQIKTDLRDLIVFIYGQWKFGKTTWCAQAENALFLSTEPGTSAVSVFEISITQWEQFYETYNLLFPGNHQFKTVVMDTVDNAYKMCEEFICKLYGVKTINEIPWGKGTKYVLDEFKKVILMFSYLPSGLYLTSHTAIEQIAERSGIISKTVSSIPSGKINKHGAREEGVREIISKLADFILFCDYDTIISDGKIENSRVLRCVSGKDYDGGSRYPMPATIPLDYNIFVQEFYKSAQTLINQEYQREQQRQQYYQQIKQN